MFPFRRFALCSRFQVLWLGSTLLLGGTVEASACDELITRLIEKAVRPAIESLDCGELGKAGIDKSEHHLESVCYTSSGPSSQIEIVVDLKCKTGDNALFKTEVAERVTAEAEVRGSDCQIEKIDFSAGGEIGKLLLRAFDANGKAREALQQALAGAC